MNNLVKHIWICDKFITSTSFKKIFLLLQQFFLISVFFLNDVIKRDAVNM